MHSTQEAASEGGSCIGWITNGSYTSYARYDFGAGARVFRARVSSETNGGSIQVRTGSPSGPLLGTVQVTNTGSWATYHTKEISIPSTSGVHDLYLVFTGGDGYLFNMAWFDTSSSGNAGGMVTTPSSNPVEAVEGGEIFNNWNKAVVYNGSKSSTYFYLTRSVTITRIINYHWNSGYGVQPGQIGLRDSGGSVLGTWQSTGTSGTGGAKNVNWVVTPNITLQPGLYQITDSEPSTWSQNEMSFGAGFSSVNAK